MGPARFHCATLLRNSRLCGIHRLNVRTDGNMHGLTKGIFFEGLMSHQSCRCKNDKKKNGCSFLSLPPDFVDYHYKWLLKYVIFNS